MAVGKSNRKIDAIDKALGREKFTDDIVLPRMLHCKIKRSIKAHAKIKNINTKQALKLDGVFEIITGQDFNIKYGVIPWTKDEYPLARDKVTYVGEGVAAVAAISEQVANKALKLIKIEYEDFEAIFDTQDELNKLIKINSRAKKDNITKHVALEFGNVKQGFEESDFIVENNFYYSNNTHAPIEPHCSISDFSQNKLTAYSTTQVPHYLHRTLSEVLNLESHQIRVIQPPVGGAFGGKSECFDLEFVTALLSIKTRRPVKCLFTREEVFYAHRGRHPTRMRFKCGADKFGKLKSVQSKLDIDGGAYASFGLVTAFYTGQLLTGPVGMDNYAFDATRYYTNKPACGPKRGHGSVQPRFAFEIHCDMLAEKCAIDPIEFRKINFIGENTKTINGQQVNSLGLIECLDAVKEKSDWKNKFNKLEFGHGVGVANSMYICGTNYPVYPNDMPQSAVNIKADRSGKITIFSGASDIGQGCNSLLASIASEELGIDNNYIKVVTGDSDLAPVDLGAYSSRVTMMLGHACLEACRKLRTDIIKYAGRDWIEDKTSFKEALEITESALGTLNYSGSYRTVKRGGDYRGGTIGSSPAYSATAHVADVSVDVQTGFVQVNKIWAAHDCGRAINPMIVQGQIEGSTYMGFGEVSLEEMLYGPDKARTGMLVGPNLLDYKIPTSLDTPDIESIIIEKPDINGPYGAKEAGEGPLHSTIPAVFNAVYDAIGIRFFELPLTPARVLEKLNAQTK